MSALLLVAAVLAQAPARTELDASFVYGFGARAAYGALVGGAVRWPLFEAKAVRGDVEVGLLGGYQHEPYAATAAFLQPALISGGTHRVELFGTGGATLAFLESRRLEAGLLLFGGLTHVALRGRVVSEVRGIDRVTSADAGEFTVGLLVRVGFRLTERLGVVARFLAPIPYAGVAISSYFLVSGGVTLSL